MRSSTASRDSPQLLLSLRVLTQMGLKIVPHLVVPPVHWKMQVPWLQMVIAEGSVGHTVPHEPLQQHTASCRRLRGRWLLHKECHRRMHEREKPTTSSQQPYSRSLLRTYCQHDKDSLVTGRVELCMLDHANSFNRTPFAPNMSPRHAMSDHQQLLSCPRPSHSAAHTSLGLTS